MNNEERDHFILKMNDLIIELQSKQLDLYEEFNDHRKYHEESEWKWGIIKLVRKYPHRSLGIAFLLGGLVFDLISFDQVVELIKAWRGN